MKRQNINEGLLKTIFQTFFLIVIEIFKLLLPLLEVEVMVYGLPGAGSAAQAVFGHFQPLLAMCMHKCVN